MQPYQSAVTLGIMVTLAHVTTLAHVQYVVLLLL